MKIKGENDMLQNFFLEEEMAELRKMKEYLEEKEKMLNEKSEYLNKKEEYLNSKEKYLLEKYIIEKEK